MKEYVKRVLEKEFRDGRTHGLKEMREIEKLSTAFVDAFDSSMTDLKSFVKKGDMSFDGKIHHQYLISSIS
jgi:hypothetical protein